MLVVGAGVIVDPVYCKRHGEPHHFIRPFGLIIAGEVRVDVLGMHKKIPLAVAMPSILTLTFHIMAAPTRVRAEEMMPTTKW